LLLAQGLYVLAIGWAVRNLTYRVIGMARLTYGVCNCATASIAVLLPHPETGLLLAAAMTYLLAALSIVRAGGDALRIDLHRAKDASMGQVFAHVKRNCRASVTSAITAGGYQMSALALPSLGSLALGWAVCLRISGGLATSGRQLVAPAFQVNVGRVFRRQDAPGIRRQVTKSLAVALLFGIAGSLAALVAVFWSGAMRGVPAAGRTTLTLGSVTFTASMVTVSVVSTLLILMGGQSHSLRWAATKLAVVAVAVHILRQEALIIFLSAGEALFMLALVWLLLRRAGVVTAVLRRTRMEVATHT